MADWSQQFKSLLATPLGVEIIRTLEEDLHSSIIKEAEACDSQEKGYGLLKEAGGVIKAVDQLRSIAGLAVAPKD